METRSHVMSTRSAWHAVPASSRCCGPRAIGAGRVSDKSPRRRKRRHRLPRHAAPTAIPAGAREYQVVAEESLLQILVYRGGAMARLGHNHVIASHHLSGIGVRHRRSARNALRHQRSGERTHHRRAGHARAGGRGLSARRAAERARRNAQEPAVGGAARRRELPGRSGCAPPMSVAAGEGFDVGVEITLKDQVRSVRVPVTLERKAGALVGPRRVPAQAVGARVQAVQRRHGHAGGARRDAHPFRSDRARVGRRPLEGVRPHFLGNGDCPHLLFRQLGQQRVGAHKPSTSPRA